MNICSTHLKSKKCLTYVTLTEFWKLNTTCNISPETAELRIWMNLKEMRQTRRAELLNVKRRNFKCAGKRNDHMLHYEQVLFLRGEKVNVVQYWWNIFVKLTGEQVIILQMDQQLKTKNISDVSGQLFCCQCKDKFLLETD